MPPQLIPCPFCDRLYTHFSIDLHQPQCLANPNRRVKLPQLKRTAYTSVGSFNNPTRLLPALVEKRSRSVGSNSNGSTESTNTSDENRPATRSINQNRRSKNKSTRSATPKMNRISRQKPQEKLTPCSIVQLDTFNSSSTNQTNSSALSEEREYRQQPADKRICFVCGEKVLKDELMDHEIECEAEWRTQRREFPPTIRVKSPRPMRIPSVDGTFDGNRMDMYAAESAERAQKTRCLKCCRHVPFAHVLQHQCTRFEPTVQFYF